MTKTGRMFFYDKDGKLVKVIEPINEFPERNANWGKTDTTNLPSEGSILEKDSIITEENGFKNIRYVKGGGTDSIT